MKNQKITVIIPAYNEEKIIRNACRDVLKHFSKRSIEGSVLVVDDGSTDETAKIVAESGMKNTNVVRLKKNSGKGAALRKGFMAAQGEFLIFMDADLSVPVGYLDDMIIEFKKGADVVIASRRVEGADIKVHQPWVRENMGRVFTFITRIMTGAEISDFTCGFKGFTKKAAKRIFSSSVIDGWAYDAEIIFLAKRYGFKIKEIPVEWKNREATRVKIGAATIDSLRDLVLMRAYAIMGKYD